MNSKYSNILTIILIVVIILIFVILGILGYSYYKKVVSEGNAQDFVESFVGESDSNMDKDTSNKKDDTTDVEVGENVQQNGNNNTSTIKPSNSGAKYEGFNISGTIEIPAINLKYPIIAQSDYSKAALEKSVVEVYGPGLNTVGNTTIAGHNYRDGSFFSNNKKLKVGDIIYITDLTGKRLAYKIYEKYEVSESEAEYMTRDTQGAIEISLSTCTDDTSARLLILAKANV